MTSKIRDYYVEEVQFLTSCGETPHTILTRLDVSAGALQRALQREGRHDLARRFTPLLPRRRNDRRTASCADCGIPTYGERCRKHEAARRWGGAA